MSDETKFPKYVYKRGTGKAVNDTGLYTAESILVSSAEELAALGSGWCDTPVEAAKAATPVTPTAAKADIPDETSAESKYSSKLKVK